MPLNAQSGGSPTTSLPSHIRGRPSRLLDGLCHPGEPGLAIALPCSTCRCRGCNPFRCNPGYVQQVPAPRTTCRVRVGVRQHGTDKNKQGKHTLKSESARGCGPEQPAVVARVLWCMPAGNCCNNLRSILSANNHFGSRPCATHAKGGWTALCAFGPPQVRG